MIRRDRHLLLVLLGMLAINLATAVCSVVCVNVYRRRFRSLSLSLLSAAQASEKASVEAASTALLLADQFGAPSSAGTDVAPVRPVVRGYGQTRSRNAVYIYRDVEQDGIVHREFLQRIPLSSLNSEKTVSGSSQQ